VSEFKTEVVGLKELARWAKDAPDGLRSRLRDANRQLAESVAAKARSRVYPVRTDRTSRTNKRSRGTGLTASQMSVRARASASYAEIIGGGPKAPAFFGHEFGGGARARTRQFPRHRGREGYFLYPTLREEAGHIPETYGGLLDELLAG
jgi:hypothetical protein